MKPIVLIIFSLLSLHMFSQECTQIFIDHIDNSHSNATIGESSRIYITADGNGDFYFENADALEIDKNKNISLLVDDVRFFEFYQVEVSTEESDKNLSVGQPIKLCETNFKLVIQVGENSIQSKSINLK